MKSGLRVGLLVGLFLVVLAQQEWFPPDFGPYESLRQQAYWEA